MRVTAPAWRRASSNRACQAVAVALIAAVFLWVLAPTFAARDMDDEALNAYVPSMWRVTVYAIIAGMAYYALVVASPRAAVVDAAANDGAC